MPRARVVGPINRPGRPNRDPDLPQQNRQQPHRERPPRKGKYLKEKWETEFGEYLTGEDGAENCYCTLCNHAPLTAIHSVIATHFRNNRNHQRLFNNRVNNEEIEDIRVGEHVEEPMMDIGRYDDDLAVAMNVEVEAEIEAEIVRDEIEFPCPNDDLTDDADDHDNAEDNENNDAENHAAYYKYLTAWESNPMYTEWLKPVENDTTKAQCDFCDKVLCASRSSINKHLLSTKHRKAEKQIKVALGIIEDSDLIENEEERERFQRATIAEIKLTALFVSQNLPFLKADYLLPGLQQIFTDSDTLKSLKTDRGKMTKIVQEVICPCQQERLAPILKERKYSILVDETTDKGKIKLLCVLVR